MFLSGPQDGRYQQAISFSINSVNSDLRSPVKKICLRISSSMTKHSSKWLSNKGTLSSDRTIELLTKAAHDVFGDCETSGVPVAALCGSLGRDYDKIYAHGISSIMTTVDGPMPLKDALDNAEDL